MRHNNFYFTSRVKVATRHRLGNNKWVSKERTEELYGHNSCGSLVGPADLEVIGINFKNHSITTANQNLVFDTAGRIHSPLVNVDYSVSLLVWFTKPFVCGHGVHIDIVLWVVYQHELGVMSQVDSIACCGGPRYSFVFFVLKEFVVQVIRVQSIRAEVHELLVTFTGFKFVLLYLILSHANALKSSQLIEFNLNLFNSW